MGCSWTDLVGCTDDCPAPVPFALNAEGTTPGTPAFSFDLVGSTSGLATITSLRVYGGITGGDGSACTLQNYTLAALGETVGSTKAADSRYGSTPASLIYELESFFASNTSTMSTGSGIVATPNPDGSGGYYFTVSSFAGSLTPPFSSGGAGFVVAMDVTDGDGVQYSGGGVWNTCY